MPAPLLLKSRAGSVVQQIDRRNRGLMRLVTAGRLPSMKLSGLRAHFFTAK
jgi:hypothetical protein